MSLINLTDPGDASVNGGLSNKDPLNVLLAGSQINFTLDEFTSSEDVKNLFNLDPPPSFNDAFMVWGEGDPETGALSLYLATTTGDRTFPFASLDAFLPSIDGSGGPPFGSGSLFRDRKLPPVISWSFSP